MKYSVVGTVSLALGRGSTRDIDLILLFLQVIIWVPCAVDMFGRVFLYRCYENSETHPRSFSDPSPTDMKNAVQHKRA